MTDTHRIFLIIDGRTYGTRYWKNVPRTGDRILVQMGDDFVSHIVVGQTWGVAEDDHMTSYPDVNLALERAA